MTLLLAASAIHFNMLSRLGLGIISGTITLLGVVIALGVFLLMRRRQKAQPARPTTSTTKPRPARAAGSGMQIQFCKRSLERLGPNKEPLLDALRERQHTPIIKDCLNRCIDCNGGLLMANVDGMPVSAKDGDKLLGDLDALEAE
jgi:hypothetical protein